MMSVGGVLMSTFVDREMSTPPKLMGYGTLYRLWTGCLL